MSETPEVNHDALDAATEQQERTELQSEVTPLPEAKELILPIFMKKGVDYIQLGDAVVVPEINHMAVNFNTPAGREVMEFIGTGIMTGLIFSGTADKAFIAKFN